MDHTRWIMSPNYNWTASCDLFPALPREKRGNSCMAGIVPSQSAFGKRNDSRVTSAILTRDSVSYPKAAFSSRNTGCPDGAYGPCDGTALRPGFADQRFRHMLSTSRNAPFLRAAAFRIRPLSSSRLHHIFRFESSNAITRSLSTSR